MACTTVPLPSRTPTGMTGGSPRKRKGRKGGNGVNGVADRLELVNGSGEMLENGATSTLQKKALMTPTHTQVKSISAQELSVNGAGRTPSATSASLLPTPISTHTSTPTASKKKKSKGPATTAPAMPSLPAMPSEPPPLPPPPSLPPPPLPPITTLDLGAEPVGGQSDEVEGEDAEEHLDVSLRRMKGLPKRRRVINGGAGTLSMSTTTSITLSIPSSIGMGWEREDERLANGFGNGRGNGHGPGNTKKRKVPANPASPTGSSGWFASNPSADGGTIPNLIPPLFASDSTLQQRPEQSYFPLPNSTTPPKPFPGQMELARRKRGRGYAVSLAASHLREVMRLRKRQLGAVLGRLEKGDVEGVDEVLMGFGAGRNSSHDKEEEGKVRKNWRRRKRGWVTSSKEGSETNALTGGFTFVVESATSERLLKTKEEVAKLRERFEAELERQAGRLAKAKGKSKSGRSGSTTGKATNGSIHRGKKKVSNNTSTTTQTTTGTPTTVMTTSTTAIPTTPLPGGGGKKKKKKRSALANASNPHHLRNYVPSRIPGAGSAHIGDGENGGMIWPLALVFLSADVGTKRNPSSARIPASTYPPSGPFQSPSDEWICPFCEYDLFFSEDDGSFRRAVLNRKKVLGRRKRARERVNRVAAGGGANELGKVDEEDDEGEDEDYEEGGEDEDEGRDAGVGASGSVGVGAGGSRGWKGGTLGL